MSKVISGIVLILTLTLGGPAGATSGGRPAPCSPDESSSCTPPKYAAQRFPSGRLGTAAAATPGDVLRHPKHWYRGFKKKYRHAAARLPARAQERALAPRTAWNRLFTSDGCVVEHASYQHYTTSTRVCGYNSYSWSQPPVPDPNFDQVVRGIKLVLCGGTVAAAFAGGPATGAAKVGLILGGTGCGFDFLDSH